MPWGKWIQLVKLILRKENVDANTVCGLFLIIWSPASCIAPKKILMNVGVDKQN